MQYTIKNKLLAITLIILLMVGHLSPALVYAAPEAPAHPTIQFASKSKTRSPM